MRQPQGSRRAAPNFSGCCQASSSTPRARPSGSARSASRAVRRTSASTPVSWRAETDPGTRLTIGKNIGSRFEVVFSQSLQQSGGLTWIVSYSPKSNLVLRAVNQDNGDRVYDFRHDLTFGRPANFKRPVRRPRETVVRVQISGAGADENALRSQLKVKEGDRFSFFRWQDDRERIENFFHERERFEARVVTRRMPEPADATMINLSYEVRPGPADDRAGPGFRAAGVGR